MVGRRVAAGETGAQGFRFRLVKVGGHRDAEASIWWYAHSQTHTYVGRLWLAVLVELLHVAVANPDDRGACWCKFMHGAKGC